MRLRTSPKSRDCEPRSYPGRSTAKKVTHEANGLGLYTFPEAARLTKIPVRDLRRWLCGYSYRDKQQGTSTAVAPLWETEFDEEVVDAAIAFEASLASRAPSSAYPPSC